MNSEPKMQGPLAHQAQDLAARSLTVRSDRPALVTNIWGGGGATAQDLAIQVHNTL